MKRRKKSSEVTVRTDAYAFNGAQVSELLGVPRMVGSALAQLHGFHAPGGYILPREELLKWIRSHMRRRRSLMRKRELAEAQRRLRDSMRPPPTV